MPKNKAEKMQELQNEIKALENAPPHRKTPQEIAKERKEEVERQFKYLTEDPGAIEWGKKFPKKLEVDLERLREELPGLKVAKSPKAEEPKEEEPKTEKKEVEEPAEVTKPKEEEKNKKSKK